MEIFEGFLLLCPSLCSAVFFVTVQHICTSEEGHFRQPVTIVYRAAYQAEGGVEDGAEETTAATMGLFGKFVVALILGAAVVGGYLY